MRYVIALFLFFLAGQLVVFAQQSTLQTPVLAADPSPVLQGADNAWGGSGRSDRSIWIDTEYLLWWIKKAPLTAPLATYGSDADSPLQGVIGQPGTHVAFGGNGLDFGAASGIRASLGAALSADGTISLEGGWLGLAQRSVNFGAASSPNTGLPVLARPIINASTGAENAELDSSGLAGIAGSIKVAATSQLQGWDINLAFNGARQGNLGWSALVGFRALDLQESIAIQDSYRDITGVPGGAGLTFLGAPVTTGAPLLGMDNFYVHNQFWGPQIGGRLEWTRDFVTVSLAGKLALGCTQELAIISGNTSAVVNPGAPRTSAVGSVLTQSSNIGRYFHNAFAVVPETALNVNIKLTSNLSAQVGYDFLYWSNVERPGDAIDRTVNRSLVPSDQNFGLGAGPARPAFGFQSTSYWAQGIHLGLEFKF